MRDRVRPGGEWRIGSRVQDLPFQKEIRKHGAGLGELGMLVKFVRDTRECVQLGGDLGVAQHLQQTLAVLRRNRDVR